jgi:hypothetical protein
VKRSLFVISLVLTTATGLALAGTAIYKWYTQGDKVACVANEFSFGCATTLGWTLTGVGTLIFVGAVYAWERFRGD